MMKLLITFALLQFSGFAMKLSLEHQANVLDIRDRLNRIVADIYKMERDYNLRMSQERELTKIKGPLLDMRNTASKLYSDVVLKRDVKKTNKVIIKDDVQFMSDQMVLIINKVDIEKLFNRRTARRFFEVSFNLESLLDAVYDGKRKERNQAISIYSEKHKNRQVSFIIEGEYEEFYYNLEESISKVDKLAKKFRRMARRTQRRAKKRYTKIDPELKNITNIARALREQLEKLQEELLETLADGKKVNHRFTQNSYLESRKILSKLVESFNGLKNQDVDTKQEVSVLVQSINKGNEQLKISDYKIDSIEVSNLTKKTFEYQKPNDVCHMTSSPGHLLLQKSKTDRTDLFADFGQKTSRGIQLLELLKFEDTTIDYGHAEVITKINSGQDIQTWSYYPWMFNRGKQETEHRPPFVHMSEGWTWCPYWFDEDGKKVVDCKHYTNDYRTNYTVYNVNASSLEKELKRKEKALKKVDNKENFFRKGLAVCSDFVNWAFDNVITSNWNFIPGVKKLIQAVYIPEGWQTPDNLADSYMTDKVCEIKKGELIYPLEMNLRDLIADVMINRTSKRKEISEHAERVYEELKTEGLIDHSDEATADVVVFEQYVDKVTEDLLDW